MRLFKLALGFCLLAATASAESYQMKLGNDPLGRLDYTASSITSVVTGSPLGVGNGRFEATSRQVQLDSGDVVTQYLANSPAKGRTVSVLHAGGVVRETTVSPSGDATALSDATAVPQGIVDPVNALGQMLANRSTCPGTMRMYEGRRVATISPSDATQDGSKLTCDMAYRVTAGPGHFSPLFIKNATIQITYDGGQWQSLAARSGLFTVNITR